MAKFLLKAKFGSGHVPPACVPGIFVDVPCSDPFAAWIEELFAEGITLGCQDPGDPPMFCPSSPNTRGQMAVFLVRTFGLKLYGL